MTLANRALYNLKDNTDWRILSMRTSCLLFYCLWILSACKVPEKSESATAVELEKYFQSEFPSDEPGGAIYLEIADSVIFSRGYGMADLSTGAPVTGETLFNVGSLTKTFVANAILQLQLQGKLSLEDSLYKFFPEFRVKDIAQRVKVKHLLTHTSGLPDNRNVGDDSVFYLTARDAENWYPVTQTDTLLFSPGSQFEYSNPAFNGLALIIEKVSGMKWQEFITQNIFLPSGMKNSTITDGPYPEHGVSHGYVKNHGGWIEDDYGEEPTFPAAGNGGVWSSVVELAKYEKAIRDAIFLPADVLDESRQIKHFDNWLGDRVHEAEWSWFAAPGPGLSTSDHMHYEPFIGWSWFIGRTPGGEKMVGHTGTQGGFVCNYVSIPDKGIFFVILCNTPRDINAYSDKIISLLEL